MDQTQVSETATQANQATAEICLTCVHLPGCPTRTKQDHPILSCDLFEEGEWGAELVVALIDKHRDQRGGLISILEGVQANYGYLPESALRLVAETNRSFARRYLRCRHVLQGLQPGTERSAPVLGLRRHRLPRPQRPDGRGGIQAQARHRPGRDHRGPRVFPRDRQLSRRLRPWTHRRGGWSLFSAGECASGRRDHRKDPKRARFRRGHHRQTGLPGGSLLRPLQSQPDGPDHLIEGHPSVRVTISHGRKHGWLRLSSLYGSYTIESEHEIPADTIAHFFCPTCHAELAGATDCSVCAAPMVPLIVRGGGHGPDLLPTRLHQPSARRERARVVGGPPMRRLISLDELVGFRARVASAKTIKAETPDPGGQRRHLRPGERRQ